MGAKSSLDRLLIVPDTHAPFHDERAWKLMMKVGRAFPPDTLVHQGDLADCYALSSHSKDPSRKARWKDERAVARRLRAQLDSLGAERKIFTEGNHEFRAVRYIADKAPELDGCFDMDEELQLSANGWQYVPYREHTKIGKVYFTHDVGTSGKYATARAMETFQHSVCIAHHHAIQYAVEGDATGKYRVGAMFGWLGDDKQIDYLHRIKAKRNWSLGFGVGYHDRKTGHVFLTPVPIVNYQACVEGRIFSA